MRWISLLLFGGTLIATGFASRAQAQAQAASGPAIYVVSYFETAPAAARKTFGILHQFAAATRREDGNAELTVLHEIGRPGRFAIVEAWRDKASFEAHGAAMKTLGDKLQPDIASPFETRQFVPFTVVTTPAAATNLAGATYVLTHVDVFPAGKDEVATLVRTLAEASRTDNGVQRFDAVLWDGHPNHFHLIEAWSDRKAREAHMIADHTRQFRTKVAPFEGAFYDERIYETVK